MVYSLIDIFLKCCEYLGVFGVFSLVFFLLIKFLLYIWSCFTKRPAKWCGGPDTWAVVTGSTDGIGLEYALQLAAKGYNLLLISRNQNKLNKVKADIECQHNVNARTLALDFTRTDIYDTIEDEFKKLGEIHVLVNNVGIIYPNERPEYLTQIPDLNQFITDIINVNIISYTKLTALVLPRMQAKGRGIIINLSSFSALFPIPLLTLYSATKVYIDYMSRALHAEYKNKGIIIQSVLPFYVSTNMSYNIGTNLFVPTPKRFVASALKTVGLESRTSGYSFHKLLNFLYFWSNFGSQLLGFDFNLKFAYLRLRMIRKRIYKKQVLTVPSDEEQLALNINEN